MSDIRERKGGSISEKKDASAIGDHVVSLIKESEPKNLPEHIKRRLDLDLNVNETADYSRVNLTEVFTVFGCDTKETITHWRIAKILDGINFAARELKICANIGPGSVVPEIYKRLLEGRAEEGFLDVVVTDPDNPDKSESVKASLADFAYFLDVVNANRNLGAYKEDLRKIVFNYFTGREMIVEIDRSGEDGEKKVDLRDPATNPKDDFKDLDMKSYLKYINKTDVQIALQMLQSWVYTSDGHRELGGQAEAVKKADGSGLFFIPLSGRMASERTLNELQKSDKGGMNGQPQEVGEMDENTGAIVRFRIADLEQRKKGGNIRNVGKTQRLAKAMTGLVSNENAAANIHSDVIDGEVKKAVYLCGRDLEGKVISGIKNHYGKAMKKIRGFELSSDEAADIAFTDVFAPCIINNENDWLDALGISFSMGKQGSSSLINNKDSFGEHVLKIKCKNWKKEGFPIEWITFTGMTGDNGLRAYVAWRAGRGDIDQPSAARYAEAEAVAREAKGSDKYAEYVIKNKLSDKQASKIKELVSYVLGSEHADKLSQYISEGGEVPTFENKIIRGGRVVRKEMLSFDDFIRGLINKKAEESDHTLRDLLMEIYDGIDIDWNDTSDVDPYAVIDGLLFTLQKLSKEERERLSV